MSCQSILRKGVTLQKASRASHTKVVRRRADIAKMIEGVVGKLEAVYFAFGDADFFIIFDVPNNVSAAALSLAANQSGFVTSKIIVLIAPDEMDQAIKKANTIEYLPTKQRSPSVLHEVPTVRTQSWFL